MYIFRIFRRRRKAASEAEKAKYEPLRKEARALLPARLAELAGKYGFEYNRVFLKHNRSNWGSCSSKQNINLNITLVLIPEELRTMVLLHELCHLRYMNHGKEYHALLDELCLQELGTTARPLRSRLRSYSAWTGELRQLSFNKR